MGQDDIGLLTAAGWDAAAVWEMTALVAFFNFSGRLEAATGMPPDQIPDTARFAEAGPG